MEKYLVYYFDGMLWLEDTFVYKVNSSSELKAKIKEFVKKREEPVDEENCKYNWRIFKLKSVFKGDENDNKIHGLFWDTKGTKEFKKFFEEINLVDESTSLKDMSEEELQGLLIKASDELDRRNKEKRDAARKNLESLLVEVNKLIEIFDFTLVGNDEEGCCQYLDHVEVWN